MSLLNENIIESTDQIVPMAGAKCYILEWGLPVPMDVFEKRFNEWARNITIADWDVNNLYDLFQHILCDVHRTSWSPGMQFCPMTFVFKDKYNEVVFQMHRQVHRTHEIRCVIQFETLQSASIAADGALLGGKTHTEIEIWPLPLLVKPERTGLYISTESECMGVQQPPFPYCI